MTCHGCTHHRFADSSSWAMQYHRNTWWNQLCAAAPRPERIDPVTGHKGYAARNDLGGEFVDDQPYEFCRGINRTGDCPMYEASKD